MVHDDHIPAQPEFVGPFLLRHARQALIVLGGVFGVGLLVCPLGWLVLASARSVNSVLVPSGGQAGFPSWMSGPLKGYGMTSGASSVALALLVMTIGYAMLILIAPRLPNWLPIAGILAVHLVLIMSPPLFSTDLMTYLAYGQEAAHGFNPYRYGPAIDPHNQALLYAGQVWRYTPSVYGPIFGLLVTGLVSFGLGSAFWLLKGMTILCSLAICALLWDIAKRLDINPRRAVLIYAANPVVLVFTIGGFHNDLLMLVPVLIGLDLVLRGKRLAGGVVAGLSVGIKLTAAPVLGMLALASLLTTRGQASWRERCDILIGIALGGASMFALTLFLYGRWSFNLLQLLTDQQAQARSAGTSVLGYLALHHHWYLPPEFAAHLSWGLIVVGIYLAWGAGRGYIRADQAAGWVLLLVLVTSQWTLPWYAVTLVALSAISRFWLPIVTVGLCLILAMMQLQWWGQEVPKTWYNDATTQQGPVVICNGHEHHLGLEPPTWPTKLRVYGCWDHPEQYYEPTKTA